jgi:hypothetical protein
MRLDASGNLGLAVTPSAWSSVVPAFQIGSGGSFLAARSANPEIYLGTNARFNGTNWLYQTTNVATYYTQDTGRHIWYNAASGTAGNTITFTQAMTLFTTGNLAIGSNTDTTERLQVTGTAKITSTLSLTALTTGHVTFIGTSGAVSGSTNLFWDATNSRLGIGTNTPSTRLYVTSPSANTTFDSGSATDARLEFRRAGTRISLFNWDTGLAGFQMDTGNVFYISTSSTERVRVKTGGQVRYVPLSAAPTTNVEAGDVYYDSTTNKLRCYNGTTWNDLF